MPTIPADIHPALLPGRTLGKRIQVNQSILDTIRANPSITKQTLAKHLKELYGVSDSTAYRHIKKAYEWLKDQQGQEVQQEAEQQ